MYFNTTTIPTEYIDNRPSVLSGLCYGLFFIVTFVGGFFQQIYINYEKDARETCSSSGSSASEADASEAEASEAEAEAEIDASIADFSNLLDRELTEEELSQLQFKIVREPTAGGEIIMTYHRETESFWYYAEHLKDVHYSMLETVARKFVIEYDCKRIYMQTADVDNIQNEQHVEHVQNIAQEQTKPIFAKFKKYNSGGKGANPNFKSVLKVIEQTNHFRYKGKLQDYADLIKERAEKEKAKASPILDYAAYRELLMAKKEN
jgi:hypothetical protein